MTNKPNKWLAALLAFFGQPLGMLYVARPRLALTYFTTVIAVGIVGFGYACRAPAIALLPYAVALVCAIHAYRLAARYPESLKRPWYSRWYGLLSVLAGFSAFTLATRSFVIEPFHSPAGSMLPSIEVGDYLLVQKWGYGNYGTFGINLLHRPISAPLDRGDIIVFEYPVDRSIYYVKRLIGMPGDKIGYRDHRLSVNDVDIPAQKTDDYLDSDNGPRPQFIESLSGHEYSVTFDPLESSTPPMLQSFLLRDHCSPYPDGLTCRIPAGHYFVLGDNRDNSMDSRSWGLVPADHIAGKVIHVFH